jgi:hypothetical protein
LITALTIANLFVGRVEHTGMTLAQATMMLLAQVIVVLFELLPFALLLLGRPTPLRRKFALGIFALDASMIVGGSILTTQATLWAERQAASHSLNDGSGAGHRQ